MFVGQKQLLLPSQQPHALRGDMRNLNAICHLHHPVMAGLVPAIHDFASRDLLNEVVFVDLLQENLLGFSDTYIVVNHQSGKLSAVDQHDPVCDL